MKKIIKRYLYNLGLYPYFKKLKYRIIGAPGWYNFKPADPRTLISSYLCFNWLSKNNLLSGTDYYEFGIFRGFNLWYVQHLAKANKIEDLNFIGFDSFFGLPASTGVDIQDNFQEGAFSSYKEEVEKYFNSFGIDWRKTKLIEGFFEKTLNQQTIINNNLRKCSFCMIDCDLYSSTVEVLDFASKLLTDISLVYFDDWDDFGSGNKKGQPLAFQEFTTSKHASFSVEDFQDLKLLGGKGKAFILKRLN